MSDADCFQALGVPSYASWEQVRQAYKDLVRVWHPDRFQADPQLRERAEQQTQKINEAYHTLKNSQIFSGYQSQPPPNAASDGAPAACAPAQRRNGRNRLMWDLQCRWPIKAVWFGLVCLTPLVLGGFLISVLRVPNLDSILLQNSPSRPAILMPARFISPFGGTSETAGAFSAWARGEAMDLWRSIPKIGETQSGRVPAPVKDAGPQKDDLVPRGQPHHLDTAAVAPAMPVNGTELLWTRRSGAGELWVSNETGRDAFATLVQAHTTVPVRAIYIQAKSKVCMRNIAPGLYDLLAEVGENWDPSHIRFRAGRQALDRSGPFQCIDVTSTQGTSGCKYDVVLRTR